MVTRYYNGNLYQVRHPRHQEFVVVWTWQGTFHGFGVKRKVWHRRGRIN